MAAVARVAFYSDVIDETRSTRRSRTPQRLSRALHVVFLFDEGVDVWRPVSAERVRQGCYRVFGKVPEGEAWQFAAGSLVRWQTRSSNANSREPRDVLVAVQESN
jgi:hypothetical protein